MTREASRELRSADRRRIRAFAAVSVVMLLGTATLRMSAPSPFAPRVYVRWAAGISDAQRGDLERRFALMDGRRRDGATWEYDLAELSPSAVRALVQDAAVADTHHIERGSGQVATDAPRGTTRLSQRRLASWVNSSLFDWFMLVWVSSLVVSGVWLASAAGARRN